MKIEKKNKEKITKLRTIITYEMEQIEIKSAVSGSRQLYVNAQMRFWTIKGRNFS